MIFAPRDWAQAFGGPIKVLAGSSMVLTRYSQLFTFLKST